jgi:threonyl-tRNA synthetase
MLIVGEQEEREGMITVRKHGGDDLGMISIEDFANIIKDDISKTLKTF